jgi:hypothetical protein
MLFQAAHACTSVTATTTQMRPLGRMKVSRCLESAKRRTTTPGLSHERTRRTRGRAVRKFSSIRQMSEDGYRR